MNLPIGVITTLMRREDVQLCESCGRYLYLPDPAATPAVVLPAAAKPEKPKKKARQRKSSSNAA